MTSFTDQKDEFQSAEANSLIDFLRSAINDGAAGIFDAPALLRQIIEKDLWRERYITQTREVFRFVAFDDFVVAAPPEGLGITKKLLYKICASEIELLDLIDRTLEKKTRGGDRRSANFKIENVNFENQFKQNGNSAIYALRRLRQGYPDLHAQVLSKTLTINQAMIEAGLRKKSLIVSAEVEKLAAAIKQNFTADQIERLVEILDKTPIHDLRAI